jgi:predicted AlkP superfamily pyrophosphatase or phosphodiesterase
MAGITKRAREGMRLLVSVALAALCLAAVAAPAASAAKPPIVYAVVIDGLDGDKIEAGKAPFISSLLAGEDANGTYFPRSSSVMPAETNPNHTAMMSGAYPGSSGIAANAFALYAPLESEDSCATTGPLDLSALPNETSGENANCPTAELVFESIRRQGNPGELLTAGIFGKPKLGRIFAGRNFREDRRDLDFIWAPCSDGADDDEYCGEVPTNPISGYAVDDKTVMDVVLRTVEQGIEADGGRARPDFTFVNLHQVDTAGHSTGTGGVYDTAIAQADQEIARLVSLLRARGEWERTVLILLSDHSMEATPTKLTLTETLADAGIEESQFLAVDNGSADFIYLADRESPDRFELLKRMRAAIAAQPGVTEALYREPNPLDAGKTHTIARMHPDWNSAGERTGDLFVISNPGVAFSEPSGSSNPLPGNHGGPQTADNFLAVTGGSEVVRQGAPAGSGRLENPINVDIAPTVMGLFGLFAPEDSAGRFLASAIDRKALRQVARPAAPSVVVKGKRLRVTPLGGRYDVQSSAGDRWRYLRKDSAKSTVKLRALRGSCRVRARVRSAAGIPGRWRGLRTGPC